MNNVLSFVNPLNGNLRYGNGLLGRLCQILNGMNTDMNYGINTVDEMKRKLIRHRWVQQDGFRTFQCERCGIKKYWSPAYKKLIFEKRNGVFSIYATPSCVLPNTLIK